MVIYPAIDIINKKCVRLSQGDFNKQTIYSDSVEQVAEEWERMGAEYIHVVDLDGALSGKSENYDVIERIVKRVKIPVQLGGGIRNMQTANSLLDIGVSRIILGTAAILDRDFLNCAVATHQNKIAVGIDAKDGKPAIKGWESVSNISAIELGKQMESDGVKTIIYTDISKDGMLEGVNLSAMEEMRAALSIDLIASGGVTTIADLEALKQINVQGAIIGRALYTKDLDLEQAINICRE